MVSSCSEGLNINDFLSKIFAQVLSISMDEIFQVVIDNDTERTTADNRMTDRDDQIMISKKSSEGNRAFFTLLSLIC